MDFTVPNPVFGIEKENGEVVVVVFSGDVFAAGSLNEKPVVGVASALGVVTGCFGKPKLIVGVASVLAVVVVVGGFEKLNIGNDELVVGG
jgi:hypothetical protein